jgi:RNA polymerase sigma factor (TIGR02999 family)
MMSAGNEGEPQQQQQQQLTILLAEAGRGNEQARQALAPIVYEEMRRLARLQLRNSPRDQTLRTTALIHEAYIKLLGAEVDWKDRVHFYAVAARAMRMILVDAIRAAGRQKRGAGGPQVTLDEGMALSAPESELLELDDALRRLEEQDPRKALLIELHYFGGLSYEEIAQEAGISEATVHRELRLAKAWLRQALSS